MVDNARVYSEELLAEWGPSPVAYLRGEGLLAEWLPAPAVRVYSAALLVEWQHNDAHVFAASEVVEWEPAARGQVSAEALLAEWYPPDAAFNLTEYLLIEWVPGNTMTVEHARLKLHPGSLALFGGGTSSHRVTADFAPMGSYDEGGEGLHIDGRDTIAPTRGLAKYPGADLPAVWGEVEP